MPQLPLPIKWILLAIACMLLGWGLEWKHVGHNHEPGKLDSVKIVNRFNKITHRGETLLDMYFTHLNVKDTQIVEPVTDYGDGNWSLYVQKEGKPFVWSSSEIDLDSSLTLGDFPRLYFTRNSVYWIIHASDSNTDAYAAYQVQYTNKGKTYWRFSAGDGLNADLTNEETTETINIRPNYQLNFTLLEESRGSIWSVILAVIGFVLAFWAVSFFNWNGLHIAYKIGTVIFLILFRWLLYERLLGEWFDHLEIFDPTIYASSFLLPSLGDLIIHMLFVSCLITLILQPTKRKTYAKWHKLLHMALVAIIAFFGADLAISLIKGLVIDSSISFDPSNIASIDIYSIMATLLAGLIIYLLLRLVNGLISSQSLYALTRKQFFLSILFPTIAFFLFQILDGHREWMSLVFPYFVGIWFLLISYFRLMRQNTAGLILLVSVCSSIAAFSIFDFSSIHEKEFLSFYANKLVTEKDLEAEYEFKRIENKLVSEFLVPEDFENFLKRKDQFEQRMRRLYFTGYLDKYDVQVFSFDSMGISITGESQYDLPYLSNLYDFNAMPTVSNHFYHIKDASVINGYIARFDNCDLQGHNGSTFLVLQPKFIQIPHIFPRLLKKGKPSAGNDLAQYAYGIYVNGRLMHQRGEYAYPIYFEEDKFNDKKFSSWIDSYRHFTSKQSPIVTIVLSRSYNFLAQAFSVFTFLFILFLIAFLVWILVLLAIQTLIMKYWNLKDGAANSNSDLSVMLLQTLRKGSLSLLSSRIRLALLGVLVVGLLFSVYLTIRYVQVNHNQRIRENLTVQLLEAANQLQNEADLSFKIATPEPRQLLINQLADLNKSVFHLYNSQGELIATSEPQLFTQKITGKMMNPEAFYQLSHEKISQFQHQENIAGLNYHAAYIPLLDADRNTLAYLNTPYFAEQEEISHEVSNFLMAYVNLYFILFIAALGMAWFITSRITRPLTMIRDKISHMVLGSTNQMIDWNQNDEIGQLVRQYNKMVLELGESAKKLSESEREVAWREMARQVAHEIKNPLTPMKLNIQHLQRAWSDKSEKLEATFQKVTKILIEQIDSLSNLASSFSDFAKMPMERFEVCNLVDVVNNSVLLFEKSSQVNFSFTSPNNEILVYTDKEQISRVFNNLIKNAIQAIPEEAIGHIDIALSCNKNIVNVTVKDNGTGIPDEIKEKVFVPSFSTKSSGMGLGLAISKKILETSNGTISFETQKNVGTTFYIQLPLYTNE
jgi:two-component system nitrogen regulation sensor histidine kinase NtrY